MARKDKVEANIDPELNNPFAALQIDGLPLGAEAAAEHGLARNGAPWAGWCCGGKRPIAAARR